MQEASDESSRIEGTASLNLVHPFVNIVAFVGAPAPKGLRRTLQYLRMDVLRSQAVLAYVTVNLFRKGYPQMKRKILLILVLLVSMFVIPSMAVTPGRLTLLVIPARYSVMQVAFDLARKYAVVLVSYQGDASSEVPLLHAWNGKEWIKISADDYAHASFLQATPGEALLIGDEKLLPPVLVSSIAGWCSKVTIIPSIDTAVLVNSFAREFSFQPDEWEWFARRYHLALHDENVSRRNVSWYDRPAYEDKYTPKVDRWLGRRKAAPAPMEKKKPMITAPDVWSAGRKAYRSSGQERADT